LGVKIHQLADVKFVTSFSSKASRGGSMASKVRSKNVAAASPSVSTAADANIHITAYGNGYLIKGDITLSNAGLKDFASWNERLGAWYISKRRAYEYDHHYGLRLFSK
jgi:hypothetical protein